jgi:hypothetical protein
MDCSVKAAMLKSSQVMTMSPIIRRSAELRKTRSSESLGSPRPLKQSKDLEPLEPPHTASLFSEHQSPSIPGSPTSRKASGHVVRASFDGSRRLSRSNISPLYQGESTGGKLMKEKAPAAAKNISPTRFFSMLSGTSSTQLDVENIKKLRLLLRNESAR